MYRSCWLFSCCWLWACTPTLWAISWRADVLETTHVSLAAPFDAVTRLQWTQFEELFYGTASLVGATKVLTAAHNVDDDNDGVPDFPASDLLVLLGDQTGPQGETADATLAVDAIHVHPQWSVSGGKPQFDIAVLTLSLPFTAVPRINLTTHDPTGRVGTLVGYGSFGNGNPPFDDNEPDGTRRAAQNRIDFVGSTIEDGYSIQTDFDAPGSSGIFPTNSFGSPTPLPLEGTTAGGDSGGPLTVDTESGSAIVGVLNGGYNPFGAPSEYGDIAIWAPIADSSTLMFLAVNDITLSPGDFDASGDVNAIDIDLLTANIRANSMVLLYDVDASLTVDHADVETLVEDILETSFGDANLDGVLTASSDGAIILSNLDGDELKSWADGDFNGDGRVTASQDAAIFLQSISSVDSLAGGRAVPEASTWQLIASAWACLCGFLITLDRRHHTLRIRFCPIQAPAAVNSPVAEIVRQGLPADFVDPRSPDRIAI